MKRSLLIGFFVLIMFCSLAQCEEFGPFIGHFKGKGANAEYNLSFNFGIEQWESGKQSTSRHQQWVLQCSYPEPLEKRAETWCSLDRTVIDDWGKLMDGVLISTWNHNSLDGTLKLLYVDWQRGKLDFNIVYTDKSITEVMVRMKFKDGFIYLDSFKAIGISRGILSDSMVPIEYKIPQYTYIMNVPIEMKGLRSRDDKKWDDMLASLSKQDQTAWEKFRTTSDKRCKNLGKRPDEEQLKKMIPNYERRKPQIEKGDLTPEESRILANYAAEEYAKCLANSDISKDGQKKIVDLMRQFLISEGGQK
jgi:hypothetical protein